MAVITTSSKKFDEIKKEMDNEPNEQRKRLAAEREKKWMAEDERAKKTIHKIKHGLNLDKIEISDDKAIDWVLEYRDAPLWFYNGKFWAGCKYGTAKGDPHLFNPPLVKIWNGKMRVAEILGSFGSNCSNCELELIRLKEKQLREEADKIKRRKQEEVKTKKAELEKVAQELEKLERT